MLVLTRREGESFLIYPSPDINPAMTVAELFQQPITVTLVDCKPGRVKVGIEAPRKLAVAREELVTA